MNKRVFVLGMGTQKAGTTWLYSYLNEHPQMRPGPLKEYHALHRVFGRQKTYPVNLLKRALYRVPASFNVHYRRRYYVHALSRNVNAYVNFFEGLLRGSQSGFTADLTPRNCRLETSSLKAVASAFAEKNICVRPILLLRDPVERVHSAARMFCRNRGETDYASEARELEFQIGSASGQTHSNYRRILNNLEAAFPNDNHYVELYEALFQPGNAEKIIEWVGFEPTPPNLGNRVNATVLRYALTEDQRRDLATKYSDSYLAAAERFGFDRIRALWPNAHYVL